jgi:hypothetical protein
MATESIIIGGSSTCSWHVSRCDLVASPTSVKGTVSFKMGRIATLETLILSMCISMRLSMIDCGPIKIIRATRGSRKWSREDNSAKLLRFLNLLT